MNNLAEKLTRVLVRSLFIAPEEPRVEVDDALLRGPNLAIELALLVVHRCRIRKTAAGLEKERG